MYALMVGTLQLSRALADRQLADAVLEQGIQSALALLDVDGDALGARRTARKE
jgi:TetR/AcrR family transcriptional repressor of nem operon